MPYFPKVANEKHALENMELFNLFSAFEWEYWIEREECLLECQQKRFELLVHMFDRREKRMREDAKLRLEEKCRYIAMQKKMALQKSESIFNREIRQLEKKRLNIARNWRHENVVNDLADPGKEFYAPQQRYGVDPARRNFVRVGNAFDKRMDDLEKRAVNMRQLDCPFTKLKSWSKPKEQLREAEQKFTSDANLKKLYEALKVNLNYCHALT